MRSKSLAEMFITRMSYERTLTKHIRKLGKSAVENRPQPYVQALNNITILARKIYKLDVRIEQETARHGSGT